MRCLRAGLPLCAAWLGAAASCGSPVADPVGAGAAESSVEAAAPQAGTPIGRSVHPRSGRFSYVLGQIEREGDGVRVDLRLNNGTHRDYGSVVLRVVALGGPGEQRWARVPIGGLRAERSRSVTARLPDVPFRVRDVAVELVYAVP